MSIGLSPIGLCPIGLLPPVAVAAASLCLVNGILVRKTPSGSDLRVFLSASGGLVAALSGGTAKPIDLTPSGDLRASPP